MVDIINMKVYFMEVDDETLKEKEVVEVMEGVVEMIEMNNQIVTQTTTIAEKLGTWKIIVIKENMMHQMKSCKKELMHQLIIKVMSNCL
jgi:hypothetical protein